MTAILDTEHDVMPADDEKIELLTVDVTNKEIEYPYILRKVDPRRLLAFGNSREIHDIRAERPDLIESIAENGMDPKASLIMTVPDPTTGVVGVIAGYNRHAAAVEVRKLENPDLEIDIVVHEPGTTRAEILVAQSNENDHRKNFTEFEQAGIYNELSLFGLDAETIAKKVTHSVERVQAGLKVAANPRTRAVSAAMPDTDILLMSALADITDEADHDELVEVLNTNPRNFQWKLRNKLAAQNQRIRQAEEAQRLREAGVVVVDDHDLPDTAESVDELCGAGDMTPLDPEQHATCPGRAVAIDVDSDLDVELTEYCLDYAAFGHRTIAEVKIEAARAELQAAGVRQVAADDATAVTLRGLHADENAEHHLREDEHAGCPGHAAYVEDVLLYDKAKIVFVCTDYAAHGHLLREGFKSEATRSREWKAAENKRAAANNKLWKKAKADRRKWLEKTFFKGWRSRDEKSLPARLQNWLALAEVQASHNQAEAAPKHSYACTLLGLDQSMGSVRSDYPIAVHLRKKTTSTAQATLIRLAMVLGACESHYNAGYTSTADGSWRKPSEDTRFYFDLLAFLGYPAEHIEKVVLDPGLDIEQWPHLAPGWAPGAKAA
jgi:ParB family chromosome partitioning protein